MFRFPLTVLTVAASLVVIGAPASAASTAENEVADVMIAEQRGALAASTDGAGFGPQSPRDIDEVSGINGRVFETAPAYTEMNLCNIHIHESAEHKGGEFTTYRGNGDGAGSSTGYVYSGEHHGCGARRHRHGDRCRRVRQPGSGRHDRGSLHALDSSGRHGPESRCLPQRVHRQPSTARGNAGVRAGLRRDCTGFRRTDRICRSEGFHQAINIPSDTGAPVQYAGSTTGPGYNGKGSPLQVSWSVRPEVAKVNIRSVGTWIDDNVFDEGKAHGVRNLIVNPGLLSPIVN